MGHSVGIIGAGPAALIIAERLCAFADVTILDVGESLETRTSITEGFGGAGAFSDGKFNLEPKIGSRLTTIMSEHELSDKINEVDRFFINYGAPDDADYIKESLFPRSFLRQCREAGFQLIAGATRHWGTDVGRTIVSNLYDVLKDKVTIHQNVRVDPLIHREGGVEVVATLESGSHSYFNFDELIIAVGRSGSTWMKEFYNKTAMPHFPGATDIGVRYECPSEVFEECFQWTYEPKLSMISSRGEKVRLFCSCLDNGRVAIEKYVHNDVVCVNGHSYSADSGMPPTGNSNFAILVTTRFTAPYDDPDSYCRSICKIANTLAGSDSGVIVQAYRDFLKGRRSYDNRIQEAGVRPSCLEAIPGDVSCIIPYRQMVGIVEFIDAAEKVFPGVSSGLMYCPEVKFYSSEADIDPVNLHFKGESKIYPVGDCSGWTRSLAGAAVHGYLVADKILEKLSIKG